MLKLLLHMNTTPVVPLYSQGDKNSHNFTPITFHHFIILSGGLEAEDTVYSRVSLHYLIRNT